MTPGRRLRLRRGVNRLVFGLAAVSALLGLSGLGWILGVVVSRGAAVIRPSLFTELPPPPGMGGGGLANAMVGTLWMTVLATLFGVTAGVLAGIHLAEFGRGGRLAAAVRLVSEILLSAPSIVIGVFVYVLVVLRTRSFSGWAGALSLALIMLPVVARTTEEMLSLVPDRLREAALALGAPYWKMVLDVVLRGARSGILTAAMLAVARVSGETAPLLFTALNSPYAVTSLNEPTANLTVTIFQFAMSPYPDWQALAWGGSLVITAGVLTFTVSARLLFRRRSRP